MARILVIDDEHNIRMMVRMALRSVGHTVLAVSEGAEGLEAYRDGRDWDLVLLDQRMPGMDGLSVLQEIRRRNPEARVVMITAFGTIDLAVESMRAGARDFLRKPFTADVLRGAVTAALKTPVPKPPDLGAITYGHTTINGFHITSRADEIGAEAGGITQKFTITDPRMREEECTVTLRPQVVEAIRDHAGPSDLLRSERFWQALCEEVAANYVWQNGDFPPDSNLIVEEPGAGLMRWVDIVTADSA
jgi:DNA-binding response OmpR family regulator